MRDRARSMRWNLTVNWAFSTSRVLCRNILRPIWEIDLKMGEVSNQKEVLRSVQLPEYIYVGLTEANREQEQLAKTPKYQPTQTNVYALPNIRKYNAHINKYYVSFFQHFSKTFWYKIQISHFIFPIFYGSL